MKSLVHLAAILLVLAVIALAYLGINDHIPLEYSAFTAGLFAITSAFHVLVSRRNLESKGRPLPAGSAGWKAILYGLVIFGGLILLPVSLQIESEIVRSSAVLISVLLLTAVTIAIRRVKRDKTSVRDRADVTNAADVYRAYGRTAQADSMQEESRGDDYARNDLRQTWRQSAIQNAGDMPLLVRVLGIGMIVTSILCVAGFIVMPGTWVAELFNWPSRFAHGFGPLNKSYEFALSNDVPAPGSIGFWIMSVAAIQLVWIRLFKQSIRG